MKAAHRYKVLIGNQKTFDSAILEIARYLPEYFRRRVCESAADDDLAQETLLKAYRSRAALRDNARVKAWLYRIAHGVLVDYYRRRTACARLGKEPVPELMVAPDEDEVRRVILCSARCYLGTVPQGYREAVYLADYEGLSHDKVAQRLGLSLAATKSRIRRGKLMIRSLMEARCKFQYDALGNIIGYQLRTRSCISSE